MGWEKKERNILYFIFVNFMIILWPLTLKLYGCWQAMHPTLPPNNFSSDSDVNVLKPKTLGTTSFNIQK